MREQGAIVYTVKRLLSAVPTLLLIIVISFLMMRAAPGGPFDEERALPPATAANIERAYDLDAPLHEQLLRYLGGLLHGDLGPSYRQPGYSVAERIGSALPVSLKLGAVSLIVALVIGVGAGVVAALNRNGPIDRTIAALAMTGISIPVFVVAPLLVLVFAVALGWFPAGYSSGSGANALVLPVLAMSLPQIAYLMRLARASMIEVLGSDFVRAARAQGLDTWAIVRWHALRPAMMPVLSYLGPSIAAVLTGSVVVEQVFGIPGLGRLLVASAENRDYPMVLGIVILYAGLVITLNLLVDIAYGWLDPRVRRQ